MSGRFKFAPDPGIFPHPLHDLTLADSFLPYRSVYWLTRLVMLHAAIVRLISLHMIPVTIYALFLLPHCFVSLYFAVLIEETSFGVSPLQLIDCLLGATQEVTGSQGNHAKFQRLSSSSTGLQNQYIGYSYILVGDAPPNVSHGVHSPFHLMHYYPSARC